MKKIYVKFKRPKTVKEFIVKLYKIYDGSWLDIYRSVATYHDVECTKLQCESNTRRSIDDAYAIVKTYYPSITKTKLLKHLLCIEMTNDEGDIYNFRPFFCPDINHFVFHFGERTIKPYRDIIKSYKEFNKYSLSSISWLELYNKIGIKSQLDLINFINDNNMKTFKHD